MANMEMNLSLEMYSVAAVTPSRPLRAGQQSPIHAWLCCLLQIRVGGRKFFTAIMASSAKEAHDRASMEK
jgi:hypothetical protein